MKGIKINIEKSEELDIWPNSLLKFVENSSFGFRFETGEGFKGLPFSIRKRNLITQKLLHLFTERFHM